MAKTTQYLRLANWGHPIGLIVVVSSHFHQRNHATFQATAIFPNTGVLECAKKVKAWWHILVLWNISKFPKLSYLFAEHLCNTWMNKRILVTFLKSKKMFVFVIYSKRNNVWHFHATFHQKFKNRGPKNSRIKMVYPPLLRFILANRTTEASAAETQMMLFNVKEVLWLNFENSHLYFTIFMTPYGF